MLSVLVLVGLGFFSGFSVAFQAVKVFRQEDEIFGGSVVRSQFIAGQDPPIGVLKWDKRNG